MAVEEYHHHVQDEYSPPEFEKEGFHCPHCDTFAHQHWSQLYDGSNFAKNPEIHSSKCTRCNKRCYWINEEMIFPRQSVAPRPHEDMPDEVKEDYLEARNVVGSSPRAAAALLRLALEKLLNELGAEGGSIHAMIGDLVESGKIDERIQKALDSVRVIGNESVHPGELDMDDDEETALVLFELLNTVVRTTITEDRIISETYGRLPDPKKKGIDDRDS